MSLKRTKLLKTFMILMSCALVFTSVPFAGPAKANAFTSSDADTAIRAFNATFWDPSAKMFWKDSKHTNHQDFWVEAELWEMVMDAYLHTTDPELKAELRAQIDDLYEGTVNKYGDDWTNNPFNDDIMWWAMGSARAYQLTGDSNYLDKAKYHFDFVYDTQWEDSFANGGIWWLNSDHTTKNACINFPAAQAAVYLYNITQDQHYLDAAVRIFRWGKTMLSDGNGKIYDRIEMENGPIPDATHYNQGTFIGSAIGLYQATGNPAYLDDAVKAAQFTKNHLVDRNGLLNYEGPNGDLKGGKTILMRNMGFLQAALTEQTDNKYIEISRELDNWLAFNTEMAWSHRNSNSIVDGNWSGQLLQSNYESWSSSGAVQALISIKPQDVALHYGVKDPYKRIEAEHYNTGTGFVLEGSLDGTLQLGGIQAGYYAAYKNVDFGSEGASGFIARASSGTGGGNIEVRLDALNGPKAGTLQVEGTGSWNNYIDAVTVLKDDDGNESRITGVHDVYLVFTKRNDDYLFNLNWVKFTTTDPTKTDAYAKLKAGNYDSGEGLGKNAEHGFLDGIHHNAYALYKGIDFGTGAAGITVHVASGNQGGRIEVKLDSLDGPTAGMIDIPALGNWDSWVDLMATIDDSLATGIHDVYLIFHGTDGNDYPCNLDWFTFSTVKGAARDAYGKLEAENYTSGVGFGRENGGGQTYLAGVYGPNHPYAMYNYIDFGSTSPTHFHVNAASDTSGGTIEVRLDGMNGPIIATNTVTGTGGWQNFQVFSTELTTSVTGKHIVFMLFKGSDWLYNFDKFTFGDPAVFTAPTPPVQPVDDGIPPGEVENVQVIRNEDSIELYWDGPYDRDGDKVQITLLQNGQQVGETQHVGRGVQTAVFQGIEQAQSYQIFINTVDRWGHVSTGITITDADLPAFELSANGKVISEGASIEDYVPVTFKVIDRAAVIKSAQITIDGKEYVWNPQTKQEISIDLAGALGAKSASIVLEDYAGNKLQRTIHFQVISSVTSMQSLVNRFKDSGELSGPLLPQLTNALTQVQHHLDQGKQDQAVKHMQNFHKHLNNPAMSKHVQDHAKGILNVDAEFLINRWQTETK